MFQHIRIGTVHGIRPVVAGLLCLTAFFIGSVINNVSDCSQTDVRASINRQSVGLHLGALASSSSVRHPAGVAERCSPEESQQQVEFFRVATSNMKSSCPDFSYIPDLDSFTGQDPVVFDIGCNKGYDSAMVFEAFASQEEFSRIVLGKFYEANEELRTKIVKVTTTDVCGACKDCKESILKGNTYQRHAPRPLVQGRKLQIHCFEPSESNYYVLTKMHARFFGSDNKTSMGNELLLHRIAMSNYTGVTEFPSDCDELCQLPLNKGSAAASSATAVPVTTVDAMMDQLGLQRLFLLKIDTEGFDVLVLQGARQALAAHKIDIVLFEYHSIGLWGSTPAFTLKAVTENMEMLGYICYFEGKLLTRLTGCWNDAFEVKTWSNVVCVASSKPLQSVLRAYSLAPLAGRYT